MAKQNSSEDSNSETEAQGKAEAQPGGSESKTANSSAGASTGGSSSSAPKAGAQGQSGGQTQSSAIALLKADHRAVEKLFAEYETAEADRQDEIIEQVCKALVIHTMIEEELFYRATRQAQDADDVLDEAQVEHDSAKLLIADLQRSRPRDEYRDAKVKVLAEQIKHHVAEEEKPGEGVFAKAQAAGIDTPDLAKRVAARKQELEGRSRLAPSRVVSIAAGARISRSNPEEDYMPRQYERDERGRFTDDDDDGRYSARGGGRGRDDDGRGWYGDSEGHSEASRRGWAERGRGEQRSFGGRYDDDDDRGGRGRGQDRDRDEYGRFTSDDDDRGGRGGGGGYRSQQRDRDEYGRFTSDDDDRGGRGGGRSYGRGRDDDDGRRYAAQNRDRDEYGRFTSDDDDRGGGRGGSGGGYRSSGRDDDRGQGGWFGDSRGHAEAARRGWETRGRDYDDDDRGGGRGGSRGGGSRSSSSRDDDRGQGGWFGDSRGHSGAARRGWDNRR